MDRITLTAAEWHLMECLWARAPRIGREVVADLQARVGWSRSTTLTQLRRMTEKGLIRCEEQDGLKAYSPLVDREEAALRETEDFLGRVYRGSLSLMVSAMTKKQALSREEIDELHAILDKLEEGEK